MSSARGAAVGPLPPPAYFAAAFGVGVAIDRVLPWRWRNRAVGGALVGAGAALVGAGIATVLRHHTTVVPHHPARALVTSGPYRVSRNPIYTGLALAYSGATLVRGTLWPLATLPAALAAVRRFVVEPEEAYLAQRFGDAYADYRAQVRRWL